MNQQPGETLKHEVSTIVGGALVLVGIAGGSFDALMGAVQAGKLEAGTQEYLEFGDIYLATVLLSVTITATVASYCIPPLFGHLVYWQVPLAIVVAGALATGLPVSNAVGTPWGLGLGALQTFAAYYGTAFVSGLIAGIAGGFILVSVADYVKARQPETV